jgi:hypothetical protein
MARYQLTKPYFGPTATSSTPIHYPRDAIIDMPDDAPANLYWLPLDGAAEAAIAAEQARQAELRKGWTNPQNWGAWGGCLPHGTGGVAERTDGGPPVENWPT